MVSQSDRPRNGHVNTGNETTWHRQRNEIRKILCRSGLSDGAFRLWIELAEGWAWSEPSCWPTFDTLAESLGRHRTTIERLMKELVECGLISLRRVRRSYRIFLQTDTSQFRFKTNRDSNTKISASGRLVAQKRNSDRETRIGYTAVSLDENGSHQAEMLDEDFSSSENAGWSSSESAGCTEVLRKGSSKQQERSTKNGFKKRELGVRALGTTKGMVGLIPSRSALGSECRVENNGGIMIYGSEDELKDLMEDQPVKRPSKPRKQRSSDPSLVSSGFRAQEPFKDAQVNQNVEFDLPYPPPPVDSPEALVQILKDECAEKWGAKSTRGFPIELTGELRGKIRNTILRKHPPDVILAMVRLLVWDWEVARGVCFPYRRDVPYPDPLAFVQYAKDLAPRIESGFDYSGLHRGVSNTYHRLFVERKPKIETHDLDWW